MDEMEKTESVKERQPVERQRRPWHTPQFFVAGLASTLTVGQAGKADGATQPPSLS
jgi:hypothetical protein